MIKRDKYLKQLIASKDNGFPKVITGLRRCGKSYLLKEIYKDYLINNGIRESQILLIELDDIRNIPLRNPLKLADHILSLTKGKAERFYVFIDEIQLVNIIKNPEYTDGKIVVCKEEDDTTISFEDVVLGLSREKNIDLYVTGSNSKLLSKDIVTKFRDKAKEIHLSPVSFDEFHKYKQREPYIDFQEYLIHGGMPLSIDYDKEEKEKYLKSLFATTYFKDVIERNYLRKGETLDELCDVLGQCIGNQLSVSRISDTLLSVKKVKLDEGTIDAYIEDFKDAYLLFEVSRYDLKGLKEIGATRKYYFTDIGLRNARVGFSLVDRGRMLENVIACELLCQGYEIKVGSFSQIEKDSDGKSVKKQYEIDFRASKGNKEYYLQVASSIDEAETLAREKRPFYLLRDSIERLIIVNEPIEEYRLDSGIKVAGAAYFLLNLL